MMISSPRWAAQISTSAKRLRWKSFRDTPARESSSVTRKPIMSMRPPAKGSTEKAAGKLRIRAISRAAPRSGLMSISRPISRFSIPASRRYSGFRTRAMVCCAPSFLAIRQHTRFVSSRLVTAMTRSAPRTPAASSTLMLAPLPSTHITSRVLSARCRAAASSSTMVMS